MAIVYTHSNQLTGTNEFKSSRLLCKLFNGLRNKTETIFLKLCQPVKTDTNKVSP